MDEKSKNIRNPLWPGRRAALLRLLSITAVLFPISWAVYAFCVDGWSVTLASAEDLRHVFEWMVILVGAIAIVFLASLLPALGVVHRFLNWLFSVRIMRRLGVAAIWIGSAAILFYTEENWRGSRAWNHYRQQLEGQGMQLDFAAFIPKPIPDGQNFAATPLVKSWFAKTDEHNLTNATEKIAEYWQDSYERVATNFPGDGQPTNRHFVDLAAWGADFEAIRNHEPQLPVKHGSGKLDLASRAAAAPAVLAGLKTNETVLAELAAASQRPLCLYPVVYDLDNPAGILLPHLANVQNACKRLRLRACAELAAGQSDAALADVKLTLYLADSLKEEPFLISGLVRFACIHLALQPVWEGLAEHAWSDRQLQELETRLAGYNCLGDLQRPFDGERAADVLITELVRKKGMGYFIEILGPGQPTPTDKRVANWLGTFVPRGWYYQELLNCCRLFQIQIDGIFDAENKRVSPARLARNWNQINEEFSAGTGFARIAPEFLRHHVIAAALLPALAKMAVKAAGAQTATDQAALACALERYRLANGSFPETLDALKPKFISQVPADVIGGKPMNYRRTGDGQFVLYSIGWNEKDDGGTPGKKLFDETEGDWVWEYPAR